MKKLRSCFGILLTSSLLFMACSKSNEEDLSQNPPPNSCDTVNMTYAADIKPILESNCYECHGNGRINGGVNMDTYQGVKAIADNGKLIGVITHSPGYPQMPQGKDKLPDCTINKIRSWIERGAQNN